MRRNIDKLPQPAQMRPIKVVGMGASRTGTLGVYKALKILGYRPYHMIEMFQGGVPQMKMCQEAIEARLRPELGIKPYGRAEFDKWFADYDVSWRCPLCLQPNRYRKESLIFDGLVRAGSPQLPWHKLCGGIQG